MIAAGQGISPPVRPNRMICPVVTFWSRNRRLISSAWRAFVGVHVISALNHAQAASLLVHITVVGMVALGKNHIVIVNVAAMPQRKAGNEIMRFGDFVDTVQKAVALDKGENLPGIVGTFGRQLDVASSPPVTALAAETPAWWDALFEYFEAE